ncbi:MAG TPA: M48 family metalloprotease [Terriglobia bacterium]|nr:M48 family metalloprotease [Terriglobia bacterium]
MVWRIGALLLFLGVLPLRAAGGPQDSRISLAELIQRPFVELMALTEDDAYPKSEIKALRSSLEDDRRLQLEASRKAEKAWLRELKEAQKELQSLNAASSRDSASVASHREQLHQKIARLEKDIRDEKKQQEVGIPLTFEIKLAKVHVIERWPAKRREIMDRIDRGEARSRKHGDVEDIGYRKWIKGQEQDIAVGDQTVRQIMAGGGMPLESTDQDVQAYVRNLAVRIAMNSDLKIPLRVAVLDNPQARAVALPGGYLFVTSGLIVTAENEAELAGELSREIARVAARQGTRRTKLSIMKKMIVPAAQITTGFFTGGVTNAGAYYSMSYGFQGLSSLVDHSLQGSSEKLQREADQLGIQYAWKAGFDPSGFVAYIDALSLNTESPAAGNLFQPKSGLERRIMDAFTEIQYLPPQERTIKDSVDFYVAKHALTSRGD